MLWGVTLYTLVGCVRFVCPIDDREEETSSGVDTSRTFFFDTFDQNHDGVVDLDEFRERILIKFGYLDTDKNGRIDLGRECRDNGWCKQALVEGKSTLTAGQFLDYAVIQFRAADKFGVGQLTRKEFSKLPNDGG